MSKANKDIFCKILNGDMPTDFLIETEDLAVFADINPKAPLHYLIVPRKHIQTINETKKEDVELLGKMILAAKDAATQLGIDDGYKLVFNVGAKGGQEIFHIHLHLLGRWNKN